MLTKSKAFKMYPLQFLIAQKSNGWVKLKNIVYCMFIEDPSGFDRPHPTHPATPACTCSLRNRRRRTCRRRRRRKGEGEGKGKRKGEGEEEGEGKAKGKGEGEGKYLKSNRS